MTSGSDEGVPQPPDLPVFQSTFSAELDTYRFSYRLTGFLFAGAGGLILATSVLQFLDGSGVRAMLTGVAGSASLIGGAGLLSLRYSAGPDTLRRTSGIGAMAVGPGLITLSLANLFAGVTDGYDLLGPISVTNLIMGSSLVLFGGVSLLSKRYSAWFQRRWEKHERRRREKLNQRT